jgi:hypothetical protein
MAIPLRKHLGRSAARQRQRAPEVAEPMQFELVMDTVHEGAAYRSWGFAGHASTSEYFAELNARACAAMKREGVRWT